MKPVGDLPASRDQINIHAEELSGAIKTKQLRNSTLSSWKFCVSYPSIQSWYKAVA